MLCICSGVQFGVDSALGTPALRLQPHNKTMNTTKIIDCTTVFIMTPFLLLMCVATSAHILNMSTKKTHTNT